VFKRFFTPETLAAEVGGGDVLYAGHWFVAIRSSAVASEAAAPHAA
jgi:hypothetical protein